MRQLPVFEGAGVEVAHEYVQDASFIDTVPYKRDRELEVLAKELVDLHE